LRRIKKLPSPAVAVAFVALFVALAGGAVAAAPLVTGGDIKNNSITAKDVKDRSLLRKDFKRGQIPAGPRGLQGSQGVVGPAGRAGRDGFGTLAYRSAAGAIPDTGVDTGGFLTADCPAGTYPTGGDAAVVDENDDLRPEMILAQFFDTGGDGRPNSWTAIIDDNNTTGPVDVFVDVICANASPPPDSVVTKAKALRASSRPLR
jgi:hypothetical protein